MTGRPDSELKSTATVALPVRTEHFAEPGITPTADHRLVGPTPSVLGSCRPDEVRNNDAWRWLSRGLEEALAAEIYLTKFVRLLHHYRFRYELGLRPRQLSPGSDTGKEAAAELSTKGDY